MPDSDVVVTAVVVSYHSEEHLRKCVEALQHSGVNDILIVDNAGDLDISEILTRTDTLGCETEVYRTHRNLGYGGGNNVALRLRPGSDVYLFCNPDVIVTRESVQDMVSTLAADSRCVAVAPALEGPDGSSQGYYWSLSAAELLTDSLTFGASARRTHRRTGTERSWLSGACMAVRGDEFRHCNGFDPALFFCEDVDLGLRLAERGGHLTYLDDVSVQHVGGHSYNSAFAVYWSRVSRLRLLTKHRHRIEFMLVAWFLVVEGAARGLMESARGARNRERASAFFRVALDILAGRMHRRSQFQLAYDQWSGTPVDASVVMCCQVRSHFVERDVIAIESIGGHVALLATEELGIPGYALAVLRSTWKADYAVIWFAKLHSLWPLLIARLRRVPATVIVAGDDVCGLAVPDGPDYGMTMFWWKRWCPWVSLRMASGIVALSEYLRDCTVDNFGVRRTRVSVVPLAVTDAVREPNCDWAGAFVTHGRLNPTDVWVKGLDRFVELAARCPEFRFIVVAPEAIALDGWPANVEVLPPRPASEFLNALSGAAAYFQLSRSEGFGSAVVESWFTGVPTVSTPVGYLRDEVPPGLTVTPELDGRDLLDWLVGQARSIRLGTEKAVVFPESWPISEAARATGLLDAGAAC